MKKAFSLILSGMFLLLVLTNCTVKDALIHQAVEQTVQAQPTNTPYIEPTKLPTRAVAIPTVRKATQRPTQTPSPVCKKPYEVDSSVKGKIIEICGTVTDVNSVACAECTYGSYSYIHFGTQFHIISYDWIFNKEMIGYCYRAKDEVEMLGGKPIFVVGAKEGFDNSACTLEANGGKTCFMEYFQPCP